MAPADPGDRRGRRIEFRRIRQTGGPVTGRFEPAPRRAAPSPDRRDTASIRRCGPQREGGLHAGSARTLSVSDQGGPEATRCSPQGGRGLGGHSGHECRLLGRQADRELHQHDDAGHRFHCRCAGAHRAGTKGRPATRGADASPDPPLTARRPGGRSLEGRPSRAFLQVRWYQLLPYPLTGVDSTAGRRWGSAEPAKSGCIPRAFFEASSSRSSILRSPRLLRR